MAVRVLLPAVVLVQLCQSQRSTPTSLAAASAAEPEWAIADAMMLEPRAFLRTLLQPQDPQDFFVADWEQRPRHLSRSPLVYEGLLDTSTGAVERLLEGCVSAGEVRGGALQAGLDMTFVKDGKQPRLPGHPDIRADQVAQGLGFGYSVVLNWVQYRSTAVAQLTEAFEASLGFRASVNMYHTPGSGSVAFAPHYDWNDVFVLQINGSKEWSVWEPVVALPRSDELRIQDEQLKAALGAPTMNLVLTPGDILYLPRGYPHAARNLQQETSTHLTVAVHAYVYETVEGFLQRAAAQWLSIAVPATKRRSPLRRQLRVLEKRMFSLQSPSDVQEIAPSVGPVALHVAVRAAATHNASLRETIVGPSSALSYRDRFKAATRYLCESRATMSLGMVVEFASPASGAGGIWGQKTGLGSASEFAAELELGRIGSGLGVASDADYARGVFQGLKLLATWSAKELKQTGKVAVLPAEKDAFVGVWNAFCSHLSMDSTW